MRVRCYAENSALECGADVALDAATSHHLARVLRVQENSTLELFNGRGRSAEARVVSGGGKQVRVRVETIRDTAPPLPHITLVQALIRPQYMDWIFRKATELGVSAIQPVWTDRCVVRTRERPERWMKTAVSAAEQCGGNWLPEILPIQSFHDWCHSLPEYECALLGSLAPDATALRTVLQGRAPAPRVAALVGPEGDFTPDEWQLASENGAVAVSLGDLVLRAETAALYFASVLRYEWGVPEHKTT